MTSSCLNQLRDDRKSKTRPRNKHQIIRQIRVYDRSRSIHESQVNISLEASLTSYVYEIRPKIKGPFDGCFNECWPAATRRGDKSPQQFALCDTVNFMKIIFAAAKFCRRDQSQNFVAAISRTNSNQFEFVRLTSATKLAKAALSDLVYTSGNKSLRQNINKPMRERHMVSHVELESYNLGQNCWENCVLGGHFF